VGGGVVGRHELASDGDAGRIGYLRGSRLGEVNRDRDAGIRPASGKRVGARQGLEEVQQLCEAGEAEEPLRMFGLIEPVVLQHPGVRVRHQHRVQSGFERGIDIGFGRIADHPGGDGRRKLPGAGGGGHPDHEVAGGGGDLKGDAHNLIHREPFDSDGADAKQTGQTFVLGSPPNSLAQAQNILLRVLSST